MIHLLFVNALSTSIVALTDLIVVFGSIVGSLFIFSNVSFITVMWTASFADVMMPVQIQLQIQLSY